MDNAVDPLTESHVRSGRDVTTGPLAETHDAFERPGGEGADGRGGPLRLIQADDIAKKYAAKQFLADLLSEWKRLARAECARGPSAQTGGTRVIDVPGGLGGYVDRETAALRAAALTWEDIQRTRKALGQRGTTPQIAEVMELAEKKASAEVSRLLRKHPLWPWLSQFPGLGGAHVAYLIGVIRHPLRFPGQVCEHGHHQPAVHEPGDPCGQPSWLDGERVLCEAPLGSERPGTGSRALWRFLGLDVDEEGRSPRKRKGTRAHWHPRARASVLQPKGLADHIVLQRVPRYRDIYDAKKASLIERRGLVSGADCTAEVDERCGPAEVEREDEVRDGGADDVVGADRPLGPAETVDENEVLLGGAR